MSRSCEQMDLEMFHRSLCRAINDVRQSVHHVMEDEDGNENKRPVLPPRGATPLLF